MRKSFTKDTIVEDLKRLRVQKGDILFIAADLLRVGFFNGDRESTLKTWVEIFQTVVGKTGTIVIPAYTKVFYRFNVDKKYIFTNDSMPESGALTEAFFKYSDFKRSSHPTNSIIAVGPEALRIISGHDVNSSSYAPYETVIQLGGKNLMLGCLNEKKLSPMALHSAQEFLGYSKRHYLSGWLQVCYEAHDGTSRLFTRNDIGGCTSSGYKFLGHHLLENAINISNVGNSKSALIDTKKSFSIYKNMLQNWPESLKCDDKMCIDCYGSVIYNRNGFLYFWLKNLPIFLGKIVKRIFSKFKNSYFKKY